MIMAKVIKQIQDGDIKSNIVILRSVFGKVGQKYFIQPQKDKYGKYPDCVKRVNSQGDIVLTTKELELENVNLRKTFKGSELEFITVTHPMYEDRESIIILGDHVTLESGTGLVHTAPGHGEDDFNVGKKYGLDVLCPVDSRGFMTEEAGEFAGLFYEEANKVILNRLNEENALLKFCILLRLKVNSPSSSKSFLYAIRF